jgi:outer membrane lipoprotein SlyB
MQTATIGRVIAAMATAAALAACTPTTTGNVVSSGQTQAAQSVSFGTIVDARPVTVQANPGGPGAVTATLAGGLAGGLIGNEIGGGRGQDIATVVGATAGAAAGNRLANQAGTQQSTEWFVRLESGRTISVIQSEPAFSIGQRVQVVQNASGVTRLQPAA